MKKIKNTLLVISLFCVFSCEAAPFVVVAGATIALPTYFKYVQMLDDYPDEYNDYYDDYKTESDADEGYYDDKEEKYYDDFTQKIKTKYVI